MQFWQKRRATSRLPRLRSAPKYLKEPAITNIVGYKVGMAHIGMTDDTESPSKNNEVARACTFIEFPMMHIYGARFYTKDANGYKKSAFEVIETKPQGAKNSKTQTLEYAKSKLENIYDITALIKADVKKLSIGQHHPVKFESSLGGADVAAKLKYIEERMGKSVEPIEVFKHGEFVDISSISVGKGWQGTIKRFGTARLFHKATQKTRHVGTLGPFSPGKVLFTVPQAGQMGFNYRTDYNKRVLKIGTSSEAINPSSGFKNYGIIKNSFMMVDGSIPGPSKRMVRIRKSVTNRNIFGIKEPKMTYISIK